MNRSLFAMAIHFHQPVGNFDHVVERAYEYCYRPFIECLMDYPDIKMTFHFSGCLLDYIEDKHRDFLEMVREMVSRKQIEIMGGAYYEPILVSIPQRDLLAQIKLMKDYARDTFGYDAKGMWIPERVWVPELAFMLDKAGVKYCILDDTHFKRAGVGVDDIYGYYLTSFKDKTIAAFPSDKNLRYSIPFKEPHVAIDYFKEVASRKKNVLFVYGDDGEKFGEWPGTHKWVFEERWLEKFFDQLRQNSGWIELTTFSEYLAGHGPLGEIQLPEASYDEMMEWSGGSWINFLAKYPEANQMHKKMRYISEKIDDISQSGLDAGNRQKIDSARRELFKGQCNCAYWHGVFGGLYLYHLRTGIYNRLIEADKTADQVLHKDKKKWTDVKITDYDSDGQDEAIMESPDFALYFDPEEGGALKELDHRGNSFNFVNTLSRKKEEYHEKILASLEGGGNRKSGVSTIHEDEKEVDASISKNGFVYDRYPRYCFRDYFLSEKTERSAFMNSSFNEIGGFSNGRYAAKKKAGKLILERKAEVLGGEVVLSKEISIKPGHIEANYTVRKEAAKRLNALLGVEFNLTMPFLNAARYRYFSDEGELGGMESNGEAGSASSFGIKDLEGGLGIRLEFSGPAGKVWYFPVNTISQSERAYELNYQCSCIFPVWKMDFDKKGVWNSSIRLIF